MEKTEHTAGPWRWEYSPKTKGLQLCGGKPRYDLTIMDFVRSGMQGGTARFRDPALEGRNLMMLASQWQIVAPGREHHADWFALINHPDAKLIEAAPDLLEACKLAIGSLQDLVGIASFARPLVATLESAIAKAESHKG